VKLFNLADRYQRVEKNTASIFRVGTFYAGDGAGRFL
jgi:hypothetical protein